MLVLCLYWTSVFTSGLVMIAHPFASFGAAASPPVDGTNLPHRLQSYFEDFGLALGRGLLSLAYIGCHRWQKLSIIQSLEWQVSNNQVKHSKSFTVVTSLPVYSIEPQTTYALRPIILKQTPPPRTIPCFCSLLQSAVTYSVFKCAIVCTTAVWLLLITVFSWSML